MAVDSELSEFWDGREKSISSVARIAHVTPGTIYSWIKSGRLKTTGDGGKLAIRFTDNEAFLLERMREYWKKPTRAYVPEALKRYAKWHQVLDAMAWLVKVSYSEKEQIKKKQFRLDSLLANYLSTHNITLRDIRIALQPDTTAKQIPITDDLKRGWYNELAFALPLKPATLGVSFRDLKTNERRSVERFAFPSWRIAMAYYSSYFYLRSITLHKQPELRLREHGATIASFKNSALGPVSKGLWQFPFDIGYSPISLGRNRRRPAIDVRSLTHKYCSHPQPPHRSPAQLVNFVYQTFRRNGRKGRKPKLYTLFDYFHDFRVWANYLEIDNLLSLAGKGYKGFLDQNLSLLLFFIGGFAELTHISVFGEAAYESSLKDFLKLVVHSDTIADKDLSLIPQYQRLQIYRRLGLTTVWIEPRITPDENDVLAAEHKNNP
jgi:hypothetical protein